MSDELTAEDLGSVHLIGVGGVGMSGLARLLLTRGIPVSGSELREWPSLVGLRALGGTVHMTHEASNLDGVDTVVYSTAIPCRPVIAATSASERCSTRSPRRRASLSSRWSAGMAVE